ncbi:methylmalonyl Co-A mutase-associated GTPase MeaB [Egibacter rhizosphaerae]|uniref:Methylmalonyl Co-A mutase-associated GTPase MeaB n=1 Tax=Egibacter rhizosphaerae TaxID=1670831 RepID=A0A411YD54_9ACTN|nr:methylmalonyl Co-A mutase-associated GTPase MeaB [Egibacter rhizosphaerae]QBI19106.1 methylmalonyl Co-A mutase-associated GTPase MeaB [Egibacter rhizosphaerae]
MSVDVAGLTGRLLDGDRRALARVLSWLEDGAEPLVRDVVARLHRASGHAHLVGMTGSPGVGKSTLSSQLVTEWRARGRQVAVLAVDPSSPFSGGALLGDRVRMQEHALDPGVYVRSMASRGHLGGLAWATPQALLALDAAGFDVVLLETVGVGQAEVEVASVADTTVVTVAPGMGDAVQAAKAGILEIADLFCVNKADRDGADRTVRELSDMQRLLPGLPEIPIHRTVAAKGEGIVELADAIGEHRDALHEDGRLTERRRSRARMQVRELALGVVRERFAAAAGGTLFDELIDRVERREVDPYTAADRLVEALEG